MTYNKKTRFGYIDIQYNEKMDKLFLLYSGRSKYNKKNENINPNFGNTVYVLNSKDTVVEKLELDKEIFGMRISDDCSLLYGLTGTAILIFPMGKKITEGYNLRQEEYQRGVFISHPSTVIPAKACPCEKGVGIQYLRCWIPSQARNDKEDSSLFSK